jgi:hypothetical protein
MKPDPVRTLVPAFLSALVLLTACCLPHPPPLTAHHPVPTETPPPSHRSIPQRIEAYAQEQEGIYDEYRRTDAADFRERDAYVLSELWRLGLLRPEIIASLLQDHYHVVALQVFGEAGAPNQVVRCEQTFPFPDVWCEFTPTLFVNHQVRWNPGTPQRAHALSLNNSTLTSFTGGALADGDLVRWRIDLHFTPPAPRPTGPEGETPGATRGRTISLWSNPLRWQRTGSP